MNHIFNRSLLIACRPRQWIKNLLVFAAPLFTFEFADWRIWLAACVAFVSFCFVSSSIYLLNDVIDIEADRAHPVKRSRPIAGGIVSIRKALLTSSVLMLISLCMASAISAELLGFVFAYVLIQVGYCFRLKHEPLLDIFCIASGFLLRAMAGGVFLSPWFLLTIGLLALFLAVVELLY